MAAYNDSNDHNVQTKDIDQVVRKADQPKVCFHYLLFNPYMIVHEPETVHFCLQSV